MSPADEFTEVAWGLAASGAPFLWAVRRGLVLEAEPERPPELVPPPPPRVPPIYLLRAAARAASPSSEDGGVGSEEGRERMGMTCGPGHVIA